MIWSVGGTMQPQQTKLMIRGQTDAPAADLFFFGMQEPRAASFGFEICASSHARMHDRHRSVDTNACGAFDHFRPGAHGSRARGWRPNPQTQHAREASSERGSGTKSIALGLLCKHCGMMKRVVRVGASWVLPRCITVVCSSDCESRHTARAFLASHTDMHVHKCTPVSMFAAGPGGGRRCQAQQD